MAIWKINILNTCLIKIRLLCGMVVFVLFIRYLRQVSLHVTVYKANRVFVVLVSL